MRIAATGRCVAVNLSAKSVSDRLLAFIQEELVAAGADPSNVIFELTETALLDEIAAGEAFAVGLAEIGCGLALDDFGTGFASLTYLRVLPARYLKIDIEFVRDLTHNETNQHLVRSIIHLARGLDKKTIAEGVESEDGPGAAAVLWSRLRPGIPSRPPGTGRWRHRQLTTRHGAPR